MVISEANMQALKIASLLETILDGNIWIWDLL